MNEIQINILAWKLKIVKDPIFCAVKDATVLEGCS
jgi:hypothetical protein